MKTIRFTAFSVMIGLLVLVSACKKETTPAAATQTGSKILVTGQDAGIGLKSTLSGQTTVWVSGSDKVGIYSDLARTKTAGEGDIIVNAQFTAVTSAASSTFSGTMYWGTGTATDHKFYAYYPYAGSAGSPDATVVPVSLATAQTQSAAGSSAHIGALDFMVATPVTVTSPANTDVIANEVNLKYNHVFTVLEFQIKGSGALAKVSLSGSNTLAFTGGTINITQATPATGVAYTFASQGTTQTQVEVTLTTPASLSTTATMVYMVINPGTQTTNCTITLTVGGTDYSISKSAPSGGFLRGKKYVVSIEADLDGNFFSTVTIGAQVWMAENLKTTKYKNGDAITNVIGNTAWAALTTEAYCWYNSGTEASPVYIDTYGALYNWYAVADSRGLCPTGWHMPSDADWTTLTTYLGGESVAGSKLKEAGSSHWSSMNTDATNETSFTALPGGYRYYSNGNFFNVGLVGYWWNSAAIDNTNAWNRVLSYSSASVSRYSSGVSNNTGLSVRCLRD